MTIVPARDEQVSNCIVLSPPTATPLRFGPNSYFPHLETARKLGVSLQTLKLSGIGLDIDAPVDLLELGRKLYKHGRKIICKNTKFWNV